MSLITIGNFVIFLSTGVSNNLQYSKRNLLAKLNQDKILIRMAFIVTFMHVDNKTKNAANNLCSRGRCYDQNFLRFLTIFSAKKLAFFTKTNVTIKFLRNLA
jgi:hypothetical protein